jgi:hypothetical protein
MPSLPRFPRRSGKGELRMATAVAYARAVDVVGTDFAALAGVGDVEGFVVG